MRMNEAILGAGQRGCKLARRSVRAGNRVRPDDDADPVVESIDAIERWIPDPGDRRPCDPESGGPHAGTGVTDR